MPPKMTTPANRKALKSYERAVNEEEEKVMDNEILTFPTPQRDNMDAVARYLNQALFTSYSRNLVNKMYIDPDNSAKLVRENKALVDILFECIEEKSFVKLRNLEIFRPTKRADAVETVKANHSELFERLSLVLKVNRQFKISDVAANNARIFRDSVDAADESFDTQPNPSPFTNGSIPGDIQDIQDRLSQLRVYSENTPSQDRDLVRGRFGNHFSLVFQSLDDENAASVKDDREYISLFYVQRSYIKDTVGVAPGLSSAFKASTFCGAFIHPTVLYPFSESTLLAYKEEVSWRFPVFIQVGDTTTKYTPRNDWSVFTNIFPIIISEVISIKNESDRYRMLLQAIALSRAGGYLLKPTSVKSFFVVAIYLAMDLQVHRYIVKPENKDAKAKVNIVQKTFDLKQPQAASHFLLEMSNLLSEMESLAKDIDPEKKSHLLALAKDAHSMISFSSLPTKTLHNTTLPKINEETESAADEGNVGDGNNDEGGVPDEAVSRFNSDEVTRVLDLYNYEVGVIDCFHPNIALIYAKKTDDAVEILKFVEAKSDELRILHHLSTLVSPRNHAVRPIRMWTVTDGAMVSLPRAGKCLSTTFPLRAPKELLSDNLWEIVYQLIEGVAFLHENCIVHLDIKPQNLTLSDDKRLTIIDFGVSCQFSSQKWLIKGKVGTKGYVAPEVMTSEWFNPFRADLYSCGVTIKEICGQCEPSNLRTAFLAIATSLMNLESKKRPTMSEVLAWLNCISLQKASDPKTPPTVIMDAFPIPIAVV